MKGAGGRAPNPAHVAGIGHEVDPATDSAGTTLLLQERRLLHPHNGLTTEIVNDENTDSEGITVYIVAAAAAAAAAVAVAVADVVLADLALARVRDGIGKVLGIATTTENNGDPPPTHQVLNQTLPHQSLIDCSATHV